MVDAAEPPPTLFAQISELVREKRVRGNVYPRLIATHKLTPARADFQMRCLDAAIETLERVKQDQR